MPSHPLRTNATTIETPLEELTSTGEGTGIEAESTAIEISSPFDPDLIDVTTQSPTINLLMSRLKEGEMNLSPDFQRRGNLWNETRKSSLIESILLNIPIPSLYVSEDKKGDYAVVDGLQRLCAIAHFLDVDALNTATESNLKVLKLQNLQSLRGYEGYSFKDLPRPLRRRIEETELTIHAIRASTPPEVKFYIFSRINQGGLPLHAQEIRNAIYPGTWRKELKKMAESTPFLDATERKIKGDRMQDIELVLRFIGHFILEKNETRPNEQNLDEFLNTTVENKLSKFSPSDWKKHQATFQRAMEFSPRIFGPSVFRKIAPHGSPRRPINKGLFEAQSVVIARRSKADLEKLEKKSKKINSMLAKEMEGETEFSNALLYATGRGSSCNKRIEILERIFEDALND